MIPDPDYPRMMFHRTLEPVTVQSADEESALGEGWARTIWPAVPEESEPDLRKDLARRMARVAAEEIASATTKKKRG